MFYSVDQAQIKIMNSTFSQNYGKAGGVFSMNIASSFEIDNSEFIENSGEQYGGVMTINSPSNVSKHELVKLQLLSKLQFSTKRGRRSNSPHDVWFILLH